MAARRSNHKGRGGRPMSQSEGLNRRAFLKGAGITALAGAVSPETAMATLAVGPRAGVRNDEYDFDVRCNPCGDRSNYGRHT